MAILIQSFSMLQANNRSRLTCNPDTGSSRHVASKIEHISCIIQLCNFLRKNLFYRTDRLHLLRNNLIGGSLTISYPSPLGIIKILVCEIIDGTKMQRSDINTTGITAICGLFAKYLSPNAPKSAGTT